MASSFTKVPFIIRSIGSRAFKPVIRMSHGNSAAEKLTPKELRIPVPWGHIAAKSWGPEGGKPVLGVHGWLDNAGTFDTLVPFLPPNTNFVCLDLSGHGLSSWVPPGRRYHLLDWMMDIRRTIGFLNWWEKPVSLIGHSLGAGLCLLYAGTYAEKIDKVVCLDHINGLPFEPHVQPPFYRQIFEELMDDPPKLQQTPKLGTVEEFVKRLRDSFKGNISENSARIIVTRGSTTVSDKLVTLNRDPKLRNFTHFGNVGSEEMKAFIHLVKAHVLVLKTSSGFPVDPYGKNCFQITPVNAASFKVVDVEGFHHLHLDHPEVVAPYISEFLGNDKSSKL